jgi:small subunit ribosomal protein S16
MPVKIRLARRGRKKRPYYHVVIADGRAPRDGKFIENLGSYNPMTTPATIEIDRDRAYEWLMKGAQPTDTVRALLKFKGVYYRKHLMRGVAKGAMTEEKALELYNQWIDAKESKIAERVEETRKKKEEFWKMVSGEIKPPKKVATKEAGDAFREDGDATAAEESAPEAEAPAAEAPVAEATPAPEAPAAEDVKEEVKEEAPAPVEEVKEEAPFEAVAAAAPVVEEVKEEAAPAKPDDLTKIEGIGPAIAKVLGASGIITFADLAGKKADEVKAVLEGAEGNFKMHDPTTWPQQADMAATGKWDELKKWQDELEGGKVVKASSEEE